MASDGINDFGEVVVNSMSEVVRGCRQDLEESAKDAADTARKALRARSRHRSGKYARSWRVRVSTDERGTTATVYNAKHWQLTHLLEKGHRVTNGDGRTYGHAPGDHLIEEVFRESAARFAPGKGGE